jgi:hypothetical protein
VASFHSICRTARNDDGTRRTAGNPGLPHPLLSEEASERHERHICVHLLHSSRDAYATLHRLVETKLRAVGAPKHKNSLHALNLPSPAWERERRACVHVDAHNPRPPARV